MTFGKGGEGKQITGFVLGYGDDACHGAVVDGLLEEGLEVGGGSGHDVGVFRICLVDEV